MSPKLILKKLPKHGVKIPSPGRLRVHRELWQDGLHLMTVGGGWKQPGRRFGPGPLGPNVPKANKVTDSDGNPRVMPLTTGQRQAGYAKGGAPYGFTRRQRRRIVHKNNHASAPFGKKAES
jgi:hypothetical protein